MTQIKKHITQEELDALQLAFQTQQEAESAIDDEEGAEPSVEGEEEELPAEDPATPAINLWDIKSAKQNVLGINLQAQRTTLALVDKDFEVLETKSINGGYEKLNELSAGISEYIVEKKLEMSAAAITLSGKPSQFLTTRLPAMSRAMMVRAFKLQLRQQSGEAREDITFVSLSGAKKSKTSDDYLVASVPKAQIEKITQMLRKLKLRIIAWDVDILAYCRAVSALWQQYRNLSQSRFFILMDRTVCHLIVLNPNGPAHVTNIPVGIESFLEYVGGCLEEPTPTTKLLQESSLKPNAKDPPDVRQRKALANQALHELYVPLAQQIKTQLLTLCNDNGISLPTHFSLLGAATVIYGIHENLSQELDLKPMLFDNWVNPQYAAAVGTALWERHETRIDCLPRGTWETLRGAAEFFETIKTKYMPKKKDSAPKMDLGGAGVKKWAPVGVIALVLMIAYPVWQRMQANKKLAAVKTKIDSLKSEIERIEKFESRENRHLAKLNAIKRTMKKRKKLSEPFTEVFRSLGKDIRLKALIFNEEEVNVKGFTKSPETLEAFVDKTGRLRTLTKPTITTAKLTKKGTEFEVRLEFRGKKKGGAGGGGGH